MKPRIALAAALGALALVAAAGDAAAWTPLDGLAPRWPALPVTYYVNQGSVPASIAGIGVQRVADGFATWSAPACTVFQAQDLGNTTLSYNYADGNNVFLWRSGTWPSQLGDVNSVIGVTMPVWNGNDSIDDADIVYNNVGFCWNDSGSNNCVDTLSIITHEEGHFLGLGHTNASGATMAAFYPGGQSMRSIEQDDIDGVCALYPPGGTVATSSGSGGGDCQNCVNGSVQGGGCTAEYNACGSSQDCLNFYDCIGACSSQSCIDQCVSAYPTGAQIYIDLIDCICVDCATECSTECGGSSSSSSSSSTTTATSTTTTAGAGGGGGAGGAGGAGSGGDEPKDGKDSGEDSGCAVGRAPAGLGGLLLLAAVGALASRRRRR